MCSFIRRRCRAIPLPSEVSAGVRYFNRHGKVDVIVIARGGGSFEDLFAFNDEGLARVIAASELPVISAVGHETDFTICDFVADLRAPTPSAAAELVIRSKQELAEKLSALRKRIGTGHQLQAAPRAQCAFATGAARGICPHAGLHRTPPAAD